MKNKTTEEFIFQAQQLFNYDYSLADYINAKTKVKIICSVHGIFELAPDKHLRGRGCPKCGLPKKYTFEQIIVKAHITHNNKYIYKELRNKILYILCPVHNEIFGQDFANHIQGHGCPRCAHNFLLIEEEFIRRANIIHKNKYKYFDYICSNKHVKILCPEHGIFQQSASNHLAGHGCSKCNGGVSHNKEIFISKAIKIHGQYDYEPVEYVNARTPVKIKCFKHGIFEQSPNSHLRGRGCPECSGCKKKTTEWFIVESKKVYGNRFDYSPTEYINARAKVKIICPIHGVFEQIPYSHLKGHGCFKCSKYMNFSKKCEQWLQNYNTIREYQITINEYNYLVDGFDPVTNTIYEFNGDFWHGNPNLYRPDDINPVNKKSFGELYHQTIEKQTKLMKAGYNFISIWEKDFNEIIKKK